MVLTTGARRPAVAMVTVPMSGLYAVVMAVISEAVARFAGQ